MAGLIVAVIILGIAVIALIVLLLSRKPQDYMQSFTLLQQRVSQIEEQVKKSIDEGNKTAGEKLESSLKVMGEIKETLGGLRETNKQMLDIGKDISSLQNLLKPPKIRGELGEQLLEDLLAQVLPQDNLLKQHQFKNGTKVDFAIKVGEKLVPIDSKFPLESFQRYLECSDEKEKGSCLTKFKDDVRKKIDETSKYILPDEQTYDFALMYVPSENIYYQTILKEELKINNKCISEYATGKNVFVVSPNSIYAYLSIICLGLRGLQIESNAAKIQDDLSRLNKELDKFNDPFRKLGDYLRLARERYDEANSQMNKVSGRLALIGESHETNVIEKPNEPAS